MLQRLTWACQAAEALVATHNAGIIHCDVNIHNLLLDEALAVKLCVVSKDACFVLMAPSRRKPSLLRA